VVLIADFVRQVRETVQDLDGDRYTDSRIVAAINMGILEMRRMRPDYFIGRYGEPPYQAVDATEVYPLAMETMPALVMYAVGFLAMADDEEGANALAQQGMQVFMTDQEAP